MATQVSQLTIRINGENANLTYAELIKKSALLNQELKRLTPNTDEFIKKSSELKKVNGDLGNIRASFKGLGDSIKDIAGSKIKELAGSLFSVTGAITASIGVFYKAAQAQREFGTKLAELRAITDVSKEDLKFYAEAAKDVAKSQDLGTVSASQFVEALKLVGSAKADLLQNKELLVSTTKASITLAQASGLDLKTSVEALSSSLNQFNLTANESDRVINALAAGSKLGATEVPDIAEALKNVGTVAASSNVSFEQTVALLEVLGDKQLKGAEAGTKLRGAILKLQESGAGFSTGKFNIVEALESTNLSLNKIQDPAAKAQAAIKLFGVENITAGKILLENLPKINNLTTAVTGTADAYEQAAINNDTLDAAINRLKNSTEALLLQKNGLSDFLKTIINLTTALVTDYLPRAITGFELFTARLFGFSGKRAEIEDQFRKDFLKGERERGKAIGDALNKEKFDKIQAKIKEGTELLDYEKKFLDFYYKRYHLAVAEGEGKANAIKKKLTDEELKKALQAAKERYKAELTDENEKFGRSELLLEAALLRKQITQDDYNNKYTTTEESHLTRLLAIYKKYHDTNTKDSLAAERRLIEITELRRQKQLDTVIAPLPTLGAKPIVQGASSKADDLEGQLQRDELTLKESFARRLITEEEYNAQHLTLQLTAYDAELAALEAGGLQYTETYRQIKERQLDIQLQINAQQTENEQRTQDQKRKLQQEALSVTTDLFSLGQELLTDDVDARKNYGAAIKALKVGEIVAAGVTEVQSIWADSAKFGIFGSILAVVKTAIASARTVNAIGKVNSLKFERGGSMGVFGGKSHSQGGTRGYFDDGTEIEVEKDELFAIVNKRSTGMLRSLSRLNQAGGGIPFFAEGGIPNTTPSFSLSGASSNGGDITAVIAASLLQLTSAIDRFPSTVRANVVYSDLESKAATVSDIRTNSNL